MTNAKSSWLIGHVRGLSLVNGCGRNTSTTKKQGLSLSAVCINRSASIQRRESHCEKNRKFGCVGLPKKSNIDKEECKESQ